MRSLREAGLAIVTAMLCPALCAAADVKQGEAKAQLCLLCHKSGPMSLWVPLLEGQPAPYLVASMKAFKSGARNEPSMNTNMRPLSEKDMQDIAAFFTAKALPATSQVTEPAKVALGQKLADQHQCARCHPAASGGSGAIPRLAGQHRQYLGGQMEAFSQGRRPGHAGAALPTGPEAVEALAHYFASLP